MISKEENILFAAEKLFAEQGFEKTSTREISRAAQVNISMISYYFGSKEKLLERLFELRMAEGQEYFKEICARNDINEWQKISLVIDRYTERVRVLKNFYTIMQTEQLTNKNKTIQEFLKNSKMGYLKVYEQLAADGLEKKVFKNSPNIAHLHATLTGTMFQAMNGLEMYREYCGLAADEDEVYNNRYYKDLSKHIKQVLKNLLGYEEN